MAKNETRRLKPSTIAEDEEIFNVLQNLEGYAPANPDYSVTSITAALNRKRTAQAAEDRLTAELATARDVATSEEWAVHNLILGAKDSVRAQYGKNLTQVQEVGLKRTADYKARRPKSPTTPK
jgi:hypothetical protein